MPRQTRLGSCCRANQEMTGSSGDPLPVRRYFDGQICEVIPVIDCRCSNLIGGHAMINKRGDKHDLC